MCVCVHVWVSQPHIPFCCCSGAFVFQTRKAVVPLFTHSPVHRFHCELCSRHHWGKCHIFHPDTEVRLHIAIDDSIYICVCVVMLVKTQ